METPSTENMLRDYQKLLLEGNAEESMALKAELSAIGLTDKLQEIDEWFAKCKKLAEKAKQIIRDGGRPGDLRHIALQKQTKELGDDTYRHVNKIFMDCYKSYQAERCEAKFDQLQPKPEQNLQLQQKHNLKIVLLKELEKYAAYNDIYHDKVDQLFQRIKTSFPEAVEEATFKIELGKKKRMFLDKAYDLGMKKDDDGFQALLQQVKEDGIQEAWLSRINDSYQKGLQAGKRSNEMPQVVKNMEKKLQNQPQPSKNVKKAIPDIVTKRPSQQETKEILSVDQRNSLTTLAPARSWTVLFDETGSDFTLAENPYHQTLGKYVALLVPNYVQLPNLEQNWHAVNMNAEQIASTIEKLCSTSCGIIGIPVSGLHEMTTDRWFGCVETILAMILRLLPLDGHTILNIFIEQRGDYNKSANAFLDMTCKKALYELSKVYPTRSSAITINAQFISKENHPWNGYVDSIAYLWGSMGYAQKQLLKMTGWLGTCLLDMNPVQLQNAIDAILTQNPLSPHDWNELLGLQDATFTTALLHALGQEAMNNPSLWVSYLNFTKQHLNSKTVNLRALRRQIRWLKACQPPEVELSPRLNLLWMTVELAEANHSGRLFKGALDEFMTLGNDLIEEDAPLVAWSRLHLAVSFTNEFDFESAQELLEGWAEVNKAIPGLQYYGQILSSLGQHQAFLGNPEDAIPFFDRAISCFERLSDEQEAFLDIQQTTAYKLIAMLDAGMAATPNFDNAAEKYFDLPLLTAALSFGATDEQPYSHHILLRILTTGKYPKATQAYLKQQKQWKVGHGHPWELIQFYRGLILKNTNLRLGLFRSACEIALAEGGPTLDAIACVMLGSYYFYDHAVRQELIDLTEKVIKELPLIGEQRRQALRNQLKNPIAPLELANIVLPFNFK